MRQEVCWKGRTVATRIGRMAATVLATVRRLIRMPAAIWLRSPRRLRSRKQIIPGISVMARAIGLVDHIRKKMQDPLAYELKACAEEEATAHHLHKA